MDKDEINRILDYLESRVIFYEESLEHDNLTTETANKTKQILWDLDDLITDVIG